MPFDRTCERCGKTFQVKFRARKGRFCSKLCMNEWQITCRWEDRIGEEKAAEIREKRRLTMLKNNPNNDPEVLRKKSESLKIFLAKNPRMGEKNPFFGKMHSDENKNRWKYTKSGKRAYTEEQFRRQNERTPKGENHPMWKGGISFEPYDIRWTRKFKKQIKDRDENKCVECQKEGKLAVHHIDYNKLNSVTSNCISLCFSCHGKTNVIDRDKMTKYFQEKYKQKLQICPTQQLA